MSAPAVQEQARWWSYERQLLGRRVPDAGRALRDVVGVYSSHPTGPLSLWARVGSLDPAAFLSLEDGRAALRLPAMRGSIHILPRRTAHLAFLATAATPASEQGIRLRHAGLSWEQYERLKAEILAAVREPRTARELRSETGAGEGLRQVLQMMTFEGSLLRVGAEGLRSNALRYVATDAWLGGGLPEADRDGALAWLAGEYLRAFGPARAEDFRWWAGVSSGRAAAALATVETVELDGGYLLRAADLEGFERAEAFGPDAVDLLPKWDCYTMGYAPDGRGRFVHPDVQDRVYTPVGDGLGVVLVDGVAAGAWTARFSGRRMEVTLDTFETPGPRMESAVAARFEAVADFLDARESKTARGRVV